MIDRLAADLHAAFPDMKGFSTRNLKYMRALADAFPDEALVQEALAQITWYHSVTRGMPTNFIPSPFTASPAGARQVRSP